MAANSAAVMSNIVTHYGDNRIHPDFGQDYRDASDLYGIPYNVVHGNSVPKVSVVIDGYPDESDVVAVPIPPNAVIEGDFQNGPQVGVDNRGGVRVGVKDLDRDRLADLVVGDGLGAGTRVTAYFGRDMAGGAYPPAFGFDAFPGLSGVFVG